MMNFFTTIAARAGYVPLGEHQYNLASRENLEKYYQQEQKENRRLRAELEKLRRKIKRLKR